MEKRPESCVMVIFGATGDLTRRKLIPAIYNLQRDNLLPANFAVCAYARKAKTDEEYGVELKEHLDQYSRQKPERDWNDLARRIRYVQGEFNDDGGYQRLNQQLQNMDREFGTEGNRLFYLAVDSDFFVPITTKLKENGLLVDPPKSKAWTRLVIEKPIGHDLHSAREFLTSIARHASEEQVYRIDHYLGKETVQNILAGRFGNCIFEPLWNRKYIDHVSITAAEEEGVGSRAGYYEGTGALRDMVQNHMMQLLCLVAMEAPGTMSADDVRNEKVKVLRNLRRMSPAQVASNTVRGQYGPSLDGKLAGYRHESGVSPNSRTETFVALRCYVETWRWAGVPFYLRTGKRLARRETVIEIRFRVPPLQMFEGFPDAGSCGNVLTIHIQPHQGIDLRMAAKMPGPGMRLKTVDMSFDYQRAFQQPSPEAYERLLLDVMRGDATSFTRDDEVLSQWEFVQAILDGWAAMDAPRFPNYSAGSWGPEEAVPFIEVGCGVR